jgi:hypothetical protein
MHTSAVRREEAGGQIGLPVTSGKEYFCINAFDIQENFDKRDNLQREKVSKRDNFPCYLT